MLISDTAISDSTKLKVVRECALLQHPVQSVAESYGVSTASAYRWASNAELIARALEGISIQTLRIELQAAEAVLRWMGWDEWGGQLSKGRSASSSEDEKTALLEALRIARSLAKGSRRSSCAAPSVPVEVVYVFIRDKMGDASVAVSCKAFGVARSGYYAWLRRTSETRYRESARVRVLIAQTAAMLGDYASYRRISEHLRSIGVVCSRHRVKTLMGKK